MSQIKLQKYFTDCGLMSRRAAEAEIAAGRVRVNGEVATIGLRIDPACDRVEYRGRPVRPSAAKKTYILLNKPRGVVTTMQDEKGRPTVRELTAGVGTRVYPDGRLDMDSDGLLLLTDDGALADRLTHPRHEIPKIYHVTVEGAVSTDTLAALQAPMVLDGYEILPVKVCPLSGAPAGHTRLEMTLYEGRNRQIRNMCAACGLHVTRLCRVAIGRISLGTLPAGTWRHLTSEELAYLLGQAPDTISDDI